MNVEEVPAPYSTVPVPVQYCVLKNYGTYLIALMHLPRTWREVFILPASFCLWVWGRREGTLTLYTIDKITIK
jgi:hypothetical protein